MGVVRGGEGKGNCVIDELTQREIKGKEEQNRSRGDLPIELVWLLNVERTLEEIATRTSANGNW